MNFDMKKNSLELFLVIFFAVMLAMSVTGQAADIIDTKQIKAFEIKGDREFGEYLASECTACHKFTSGDNNIPVIAGRSVNDFIIALYSYKLKRRRSQVMEMVADRLSDEEIAALAAYFSSLK